MWQIASASASAASAGDGGASSRSSRVTIAPTWALSARPLPETAAFTSLGVCSATGMPRRAATTSAMPLAWAVPMTVRTLCWLNTRSTATASGRCRSIHSSSPASIATSRCATGRSDAVRTTPTPTRVRGRPTSPSTTPTPHRVSPGSIPSTRIARPLARPNTCSHHASRPAGGRVGATRRGEGRRIPKGSRFPGASRGVYAAGSAVPLGSPERPDRMPEESSIPWEFDGRHDHASSDSMTSSETSKLAKTFCTSSRSSSAS